MNKTLTLEDFAWAEDDDEIRELIFRLSTPSEGKRLGHRPLTVQMALCSHISTLRNARERRLMSLRDALYEKLRARQEDARRYAAEQMCAAINAAHHWSDKPAPKPARRMRRAS